MGEDEQIPTILNVLPQIVSFGRSEAILRCGDDQKMRLLNLLEIYGILVESNLPSMYGYLVHFLVFLHKFLEVGARVADLLLTSVEDYLNKGEMYHLLTAHQFIFQIYYLNIDLVKLSLL